MELVNLANVQVPDHGCGLQEIRKFQDYFATRNTAIVVYNFSTFGRSAPPIYDGTQTVGVTYGNAVLHVLRIMYYERAHHYQPILNLVAAAGSAGYCIPCNKSYWRAEEHRCSNKCYKCMSSPPCSTTAVLKKCNDCLRLFFGDNCRANHARKGTYNRNSSVCSKVKLCQNCFKIIQINRKDPHKCGISYCTTCKSRVPIRHLCHVQPIKSSNSTNLALFLFYDFETQQSLPVLGDEEKKVHVPNLCVVQQVCTYCIEIEDISIRCEKCGIREYVFADEPVKQFVELAIAPRQQFRQVVCIAHNSQGFDAQFIFKYIVETFNEGRVVPSVVMNGSKIILMEVLQAKFIDSLNYFHMSLASLPKAYGLPDVEKGVFPHLFNTAENQSYEGPLPPLDSYAAESMSVGERENFLKWYTDQQQSGYMFNFQSEIVKYCKQDVKILRLACLAFRKTFMKYNVDPFVECTTIASSCMRVFRKKFLKKDQIGIIPPRGYRMTDNQSEIALHWLAWMEQRVLHRHIEHAGRGQEKRLTEGIVVDGYCAAQENEAHRGIVLQFHGCFWHGCPRCYTINRDLDLTSGESMDARYEKTLAISDRIMTANYQLIEKWECQFNTEISQNEELHRFVDENRRNIKRKSLDPRDVFFGGRTGNTVFDCQGQEKIKYVDVCSLYPFICKHGKYPVGHPKIFVGEEECRQLIGINNDISQVNGLISCDILPPQNLYHPLLPVKMHGKLIFPLCRTCCEQLTQDDCPHEDPEERVLRGTWVSEEVKAAVTLGYVVKSVYEIWQYEMTQYSQEEGKGGIFAEYINEFFTQKVAASGYPPECITEEDKERYVEQLKHNEGINLNKHDICLNAGLRSVAKLCLNSLWGKFGQRENLTRTLVVKNRETLMNLLTSAEVEVNGILPVNDDTLYVNWCYRDEALTSSVSSSMTNVVLAAFTTAQARLKLFGYLHALGPRALYYDTDSVFYVCKGEIGEFELPIGTSLGSLTDELADKGPGTYITSFLSGGPKFYAYKCRKPNGQ